MSNTRKAEMGRPLNYDLYMDRPELAELEGISATAVARRCALLVSAARRQLLWFIQGMSLREGGLRRFARELADAFPDRCHRDAALFRHAPVGGSLNGRYDSYALPLYEFLVDLCVNPCRKVNGGGDYALDEIERERVHEEFGTWDVLESQLDCFGNVMGALWEFKRRYEESVKASFCLTAIGRQVWGQLDDALESQSMVVIDGLEGRGKSCAVRAYCDCHLGVARYASLEGASTKTEQFRELARALGVGHGTGRKASGMRAEIKEVLRGSRLLLVVDEAHFAFSGKTRMSARPEMLDWIDTALVNSALPIALITTPQFLSCMEQAARQTGWNYRQFRRRCKRYVRLAERNSPEDIERVARKLLPAADGATVKAVLGYEALTKRDLSAVGDVAREAKLLADREGAKHVAFKHVRAAIHEVLLASDQPWAEMERRIERGRGGRRLAAPIAAELKEAAERPAPAETDRLVDRTVGIGARTFNRPEVVVA